MTADRAARTTVSVAVTGRGGSGIMTTAELLLDAAARAGWYGMMARSLSPHIRGGEAAGFVRLAQAEVGSCDDAFDVAVVLDWASVGRFVPELPLGKHSLVISDDDGAEPHKAIIASGARLVRLPLEATAKAIPGARPNMVVLGALAAQIRVPEAAVDRALAARFAAPDVLEGARAAVAAGRKTVAAMGNGYALAPGTRTDSRGRWSITGNEATGLGALTAGVRFAAAYPITPATEILEWLAPHLEASGGTLMQAEDELASINMIIGASFGGTPAMTATAGPGLSLMVEGIGLAVATETPLVIVDVMRGGPSTGIPVKSEQSDLNIALYGVHGDAPHIVTAPTSSVDCLFTAQWSVHLAEALQCPAVMLSDQWLGQSRVIADEPAPVPFVARRLTAPAGVKGYQRYALTASGVSPMALPGTAGGEHESNSTEHAPTGMPSGRAEDHVNQLEKRARKLATFDFGEPWALVEGEGEVAVVTWGSSIGPAREAVARARARGLNARLIGLRLLQPAQTERFARAIEGVKRVLVVEQSHGRQFYHYLCAWYHDYLPADVAVFHRAGPLPIRPGEVTARLINGV